MKKIFFVFCVLIPIAITTAYYNETPGLVEAQAPIGLTAETVATGIVCVSRGENGQPSCVYVPQPGVGISPTITQVGASATPTRTPTSAPTLVATPTRTLPAPTLTRTPIIPTATPVTPLLVNGDFESPNQTGWTVFHIWPNVTEPNDERGHPDSRVEGAQSLRFFNENRCWLSGVYQQVPVTPFQTYAFSVRGHTWASYTSVFPSPSDTNVTDGIAVGIDPSGGVNPLSTGIVWVEADNTEIWRLIEVQATAFTTKITVFIRARLGAIPPSSCQWALPFMVGFVDNARLEIVP